MIEEMIRETEKELKALKKYPEAKLIEIIKEVGFECDLCGMCCTRQFNDHVFLLEKDVEAMKQIDASLITPAPYYEFCDQKGNFYVSGYSLKTKEDGSCVLLENNRCTIYDKRPTIAAFIRTCSTGRRMKKETLTGDRYPVWTSMDVIIVRSRMKLRKR